MKCSACSNDECKGDYEQRHKCLSEKEKMECTCICQITPGGAFVQKAISIGTGVKLVTGD